MMRSYISIILMILGTLAVEGQTTIKFANTMDNGTNICTEVWIVNNSGGSINAYGYTITSAYNQNVIDMGSITVTPGPSVITTPFYSVNVTNTISITDFGAFLGTQNFAVADGDSILMSTICFDLIGTGTLGLIFNQNETAWQDGAFGNHFFDEYIDDDQHTSALLPIELLSFEAKRMGDYESRLAWATLSEVNNEYFELEHSLDGVAFKKIAEIDGAGNSQIQIDYQYVHDEPLPGLNYYRLKQVDFDGVYSYSDIRTVYFEPSYEVEVYPNPFAEELRIQHKYPHEVSIELLDSQSKVLRREADISNHHRMQLSEYPAGIYYLRVIDSEQVKLLQLVKN